METVDPSWWVLAITLGGVVVGFVLGELFKWRLFDRLGR